MPDGTAPATGISLTESAAKRIKTLAEMEGNPDLMLRIQVSGGGCSGFQYGFDLDDKVNDDDQTFERNGVKVVVDETSLELLAGSELDFKEDMMGQYFSMSNPNASSTCGCGSSFGI